MVMLVSCDACLFWHRLRPDWTGGECRRHAPMRTTDSVNPLWPTTGENDSCGDGVAAGVIR